MDTRNAPLITAEKSPGAVKHVLFPHEVERETPVGGKARSLALMTQAGLEVPPWIVVLPSAFYASVSPEIARGIRQPDSKPRDLVGRATLSEEVRKELTQALTTLAPAGTLCAVRSSALEEDSARLSFAGQLESFLFVEPVDVAERIVRVWASGFNDRLMRYRHEFGLDPMASVPAVIVQVMIDGEVSGVAFSVDPVSGRWAITVVAAVPGLGNALVSGEAAADTWRLNRTGVIVGREIVTKTIMQQRDPSRPQGVKSVAVPESAVSKASLSDDQVCQVANLARCAERHFGRPQDIEWTWANGRLYLLQSRPITTLTERVDPDASAILWDNSNIIESYSGVTTPLTYSFARKAYENVYREFFRMMKVPAAAIETNADKLRCMIGLVQGRVYYNLYNWYELLSLLPGYRFNRKFMEQMFGLNESIERDLGSQRATTQNTFERILDSLRFAQMALSLAVNIATLPRRIDRFYRRLRESLGDKRPDLSAMRADELAAYYRGIERNLLTHWDAPVVNDFGTMIFHGLLRHLCSTWIGDKEGTLCNALLCAERGMISEEPAIRVREMARIASADPALISSLCDDSVSAMRAAIHRSPSFQQAFDAYIEKFGDRCMGELKLESATLHDDPTPLLRSIGNYARLLAGAGQEKEIPEVGAREEGEQRVHAALASHPLRRPLFRSLLKMARARVLARENLRFQRTLVFGRARQIVLEIASRLVALDYLADARDIFYLEFEEVLAFVEGHATTTNLRGLVDVRRAEFDEWLEAPAPADRFLTRGIVYCGNSFASEKEVLQPTGDSLRGTGCCPGVVRGPVHLVRDPRDAAVKPGEIVVANRTDPGWVMIFPVISGLLVERGSLLSHSAIVARELNLPTIVGLPGAMTWLQDNDWVEMDGSTGVVVKIRPFEQKAEASRGSA